MCILGKPLKQQNCRTMIKLTFFGRGGVGVGAILKQPERKTPFWVAELDMRMR